jgi:hypothetical protein
MKYFRLKPALEEQCKPFLSKTLPTNPKYLSYFRLLKKPIKSKYQFIFPFLDKPIDRPHMSIHNLQLLKLIIFELLFNCCDNDMLPMQFPRYELLLPINLLLQ